MNQERPSARRRQLSRHEDASVAEAIDALIELAPEGTRSTDLLQELLTQVMQLPSDRIDRGEMKILSQTIKDFRNSFNVFGAHRERRKISIFGSARSPAGSPIYEHCKQVAAAAVEQGYMISPGAGPGIMEAGNEGAGRENSFGVSIILPFDQDCDVCEKPFIDPGGHHSLQARPKCLSSA